MNELPKLLESKVKIRFQDCDPFNHLNNAAYLNYLINAREDQILEHYGLDIYKMAKTKGISWVTASNQITYIKPAFLMEEVIINSQLILVKNSSIKVELKMWNSTKTELKAIMWSTFVHFNLITQKSEKHSKELMEIFNSVVIPIETYIFEERLIQLKKQLAALN